MWVEDTAFENDFRAIYPGLCRFAAALLGDRAQGEEIAQEALLRLYRIRAPRPAGEEARAWALRVARNLAINAARRRARWGRIAAELSPGRRSGPEPEAALDRRRLLEELWAALRALPERQQTALLLREQQGLSYREIAGVMRVSLATVKVSIFRARTAIRARRGVQAPVSKAVSRTARSRP